MNFLTADDSDQDALLFHTADGIGIIDLGRGSEHPVVTFPHQNCHKIAYSKALKTLVVSEWKAKTVGYKVEGIYIHPIWSTHNKPSYGSIKIHPAKQICLASRGKRFNTVILRLSDGEILSKINCVHAYLSPYDNTYLSLEFDMSIILHKVTGETSLLDWMKIPVLSVTFSSTQVMIAGIESSISCYDIFTGKLLFCNSDKSMFFNVRKMCYNVESKKFTAILNDYKNSPICALVEFDSSGTMSHIADLDSDLEYVFCKEGSVLASSEGNLINISSGTQYNYQSQVTTCREAISRMSVNSQEKT